MIEARIAPLEPLQLQEIRELARSAGPCITILLPPYHPGEHSQPMAALLKGYLKDVTRQLVERRVPASVIRDLVEPLEQLAADPDLLDGSHWGRAIFRSPEVFRQIFMTEPVKARLHIGGCFEIRPILAELSLPAEFYLLKLSKKNVELVRCTGVRTETVQLPPGVPATLEEALAFKQPDHDLENRAFAGASMGAMHGVRFGTGSAKETQHAYLADFYKAVDRGVRELLHAVGAPLVLAGVDEDTVLYRMANRYQNLLARSVHGNPGGADGERHIVQQAYAAVRSDCTERAFRELVDSKERVARARYSTGLSSILRAAVEGRVASLYIDESARMFGVFEGTRPGARWNWGEEDLLNVAAVETILQGGRAHVLPNGKIPDGAALAAIFRF